jgi:hypothetical protein
MYTFVLMNSASGCHVLMTSASGCHVVIDVRSRLTFVLLSRVAFCTLLLFIQFYKQRAGVDFGKEAGWLTQWLEKFVEDVGMEKASKLLKSYSL